MLHVHLSNRIEALAASLLHQLDGPRDDLFAPETVIVPSMGVQRWLALRIADAHGVCAQVSFHFLAAWLWARLRTLRPTSDDGRALAPAALAWRLWRSLGDGAFVASQPRLASYQGEGDEVMRYELALRCADALDQVLTYRPDWLQAWGRGQTVDLANDSAGDQAWQAALWQRVAHELASADAHPLQPLGELARSAAPGALPPALRAALPASLHLFALPAIAPLHAELLQALSRHTEVHVYALNPCREYWFELIPPRRFNRLAHAAEQGHEIGHPLLAGWGRQTQASLDTLLERCPDAMLDDGLYDPLPADASTGVPSLLAQLHNGLLDLAPPGPGSLVLADGDRSIELHRCHSLTRELEVLHDRLLGLFAEDPTLRPDDVLVVTPDLATAAPLVEAVFDAVPPERFIAWRITGLSQAQGSAPARCLLALLDLLASRAPASELFALLQEPLVARRFALDDDDDLARLHDALVQAGLHGGLDGHHRQALGLGTSDRHTLDDAVQRLLLGHLMSDGTDEPVGGRLPCGELEGRQALVLGSIAHYAQALQRLQRALSQARPAAAWSLLLTQATEVFFQAEGDEWPALQELRQTLDDVARDLLAGGLEDSDLLGLPLLRRALGTRLDEPARGGVPGGGVSFAAMGSLRSLPYRVVALVGMDGGAFPARSGAADFDLLAPHPRRGDRQRQLDDRNLFLDLLLAARGHVHLSCTARSARDNSARPPSGLIDELLAFLVDGLATADADDAERAHWRQRLVVDHPLQVFAVEPFLPGTDQRARSHDATLAAALQGALRGRAAGGTEPDAEAADGADTANAGIDDDGDGDDSDDSDAPPARPEPRFFRAPLPPHDEPARTLSLDALARFLRNPSRVLLRERLDLVLPFDDETLQDDEPFLLDRGIESQLAARLLPRAMAGASTDRLLDLALAGPEPPEGAIGTQQLREWLRVLQAFARRLTPLAGAAAGAPTEPLSLACTLDVDGEPWQLTATLGNLRPRGLVAWRFDRLNVADQLNAWLQHLMLQACAPALPAGMQPQAVHLARDAVLAFTAVPAATRHLADLLRLLREGESEPLPLHLRAAEAYVREGLSLKAARNTWHSNAFHRGEDQDASRRLALRGCPDALGERFQQAARTVFEPLRQHARQRPPWDEPPAAVMPAPADAEAPR